MGLETKFCGLKLRNPLVLSPGILGINAQQMIRVARIGAGAITTKTLGPEEREGNNNPTVISWEHGLLNAVGLSNAGYKNCDHKFRELKELKKIGAPLIVSIFGENKKQFAEIAEYIASKKPDAIELDVSCPNQSKSSNMEFAAVPEAAASVVSEVKKVTGKIPVIIKLTPACNSPVMVAKACEEAGADAFSAANTMPGMIINIDARRPVLHFKKGGMSGPALKPINLKIVYELYENIKVPIIGGGGINTGKDAIEYIMAGATLCGIGSGVYYRGIGVFAEVNQEIEKWMKENKVKKLDEIRGAAHE